jgi:hypothetical protein
VATRIGIELSPVACRLVELDGLDVVPGRPPATRVRSYSILPPSGPETLAQFASIGRRPVSVVVWGVRSDHRQVVVSNGSYEKMRAEALASARAAGVDPRGTFADIAPASTAIKGTKRQPVVLALANADDVSAAIQPLVEAGVQIRSIITPADALLGLARSRQALGLPDAPGASGGIEAYIALDATATCVALVRGGALLGARELSWGYESRSVKPAASGATEVSPRRDDLAARLADELADFLMMVGARHEHDAVTQVSICGGLAELRTMAVPLMERLDVEVETLDSLFGIDVEHLPEPADDFRERAAELRLAWSAAADWRGPINMMRYRRRRERRVALARVAVVAGVAAGLGTGWAIEQSQWWQSTAPKPIARTSPPPVARPAPSSATRASAAPRRETPPAAASKPPPAPPLVAAASPPVTTPPQAPLPTAVAAEKPLAPQTSRTSPASAGSVAAAPPRAPVPPPPAARVSSPAAPSAAAPAKPAPIVPAGPTPAPPARPTPVAPSRPILAAPARPAPEPPATAVPRVAPSRQPPAEPPPVPFPAVLGTILYSPDRKYAIINDRIVGPGDEVNGARVVDITPTTVLLRDEKGRLRSLTLGAGRPPAAAR